MAGKDCPRSSATSRGARLLALAAALVLMAGFGLAASGCAGDPDGAAQDIPLRYVFEVGDTWVLEENRLEQGTVDAALLGESGDPVPLEDTTRDRRAFTVLEVTDDGEATLSMIYETLDRTMDRRPQDFSDCRPQEMTMTVDRTGLVTSFHADSEGLVDSGLPGYRQEDQYAAMLDSACDLTALHHPDDGHARVGEEWLVTYELGLPGLREVKATLSAKLREVRVEGGRQVAVIDYTVTTPTRTETSDGSAPFLDMVGDRWNPGEMGELVVEMTTTNELSYEGTATVDTATGRVISSEGTVTMWNEYAYTKAPEALIPLDERGPFRWGGTSAVTLTEVE